MKMIRSFTAAAFSFVLASMAIAQNQHAFLWDSVHGMQDLGTLGGNSSSALGVNDSGTVTGYSYLSDNVTTHAFLWTALGGLVDIGASFPGTNTLAFAINASGNVTGEGVLTTGKQVPAYFSGGVWQTLPPNTGDNRNVGYGINASNQVTGQRYDGEVVHAFVWNPGGGITFLNPLPTGLHSIGIGINNARHVTGTGSNAAGAFVGIYWPAPTKPVLMGALNNSSYTQGLGINNNNEVVGANAALQGFYWSRATKMVPMQSLGGTVSAAFAITDGGQITGFSSNASGATHAVLWNNYTAAPQDLGTLPGGVNSYAHGLNNVGQVVGYSDVP